MMRIIFFSSAAAVQPLRSARWSALWSDIATNWLAAMRARWHALTNTLRRAIGVVTGLLTLAAGALVLALLA